MHTAEICWKPESDRYYVVYSGKTVIASKHLSILTDKITQQSDTRLRDLGITQFVLISQRPTDNAPVAVAAPQMTVTAPVDHGPELPTFSTVEKFGFIDAYVDMIAAGTSHAMLVAGPGGIGKSHAIMRSVSQLGFVDACDPVNSVGATRCEAHDTPETMERKIRGRMALTQNREYVVIKGYATGKAIYRTLWENRNAFIIFDDCDKVLTDPTAVSLLKSALDSKKDRWIHWLSESFGGSDDLPPSFKFTGQVLFITNLAIEKVDEAVRTRCYVVDVAMNTEQRLEWIKHNLRDLEPNHPMELKEAAFDLLTEYRRKARGVNYRVMIRIINIFARHGYDVKTGTLPEKTKRMAIFSLTQD